MSEPLHQLVRSAKELYSTREAVSFGDLSLSYSELDSLVDKVARAFAVLGLVSEDRIGIYLPKQLETVISVFGASRAGGVFVPINPVLKPKQVGYILRDCNVRFLITNAQRLSALSKELAQCPDLEAVVTAEEVPDSSFTGAVCGWADFLELGRDDPQSEAQTCVEDTAAILYTSGSTGKPKGVVLSHRNIVLGAKSVSSYLKISSEDRILALLALSFDYGLNQITSAFYSGACVVLLNYLLPRDVITTLAEERITGLACVPPMWLQLTDQEWPAGVRDHLRYVTNSGGSMPRHVTQKLRATLPNTDIYLMYGLTEAFRSTFLPPEQVDIRPDSIGQAIPFAEILVVDKNGNTCPAGVPGELVHCGPLVAKGYWNDPARTAIRFKPRPGIQDSNSGPEVAVWSGDIVTRDEEGYLYFVGRNDEMIKTSGYRVSPTEVEEVIYGSDLVGEAVAIGAPHPRLGQAIVVFVTNPANGEIDISGLKRYCQRELPGYMVPATIVARKALSRNANGKIDRKSLAEQSSTMFGDIVQ